MKKIILIGFIMLFIASAIASATPLDSLKQYYEADKNENIDSMIALTDFSEDSEFKEETRRSMEALAEIFDTTYYVITNEKEFVKGDDAIIYYHIKTELEDKSGKSTVIDLDYVAILHNSNGWKVVYIQPKYSFEQNMILRETAIAIGESYVEEVDFSELDSTSDPSKKIADKEDIGLIESLFILFATFILLPVSIIFWLWMLIDCLIRKNLNRKLLWVILIIIFGVIAALIYFFTERKRAKGVGSIK
jgi:hypothetical protein